MRNNKHLFDDEHFCPTTKLLDLASLTSPEEAESRSQFEALTSAEPEEARSQFEAPAWGEIISVRAFSL